MTMESIKTQTVNAFISKNYLLDYKAWKQFFYNELKSCNDLEAISDCADTKMTFLTSYMYMYFVMLFVIYL